MDEFNLSVGSRLRMIREIINEGSKLSSEQFAYMLGESKDKIINYELGRSTLPVKILYELYKRGINPIFIIAGQGEIFLNDSNGNRLKNLIQEKLKSGKLSIEEQARLKATLKGGAEFIKIYETTNNFKVAAGKIK